MCAMIIMMSFCDFPQFIQANLKLGHNRYLCVIPASSTLITSHPLTSKIKITLAEAVK
jgi:hypothetical protein